MNCDYVINHSFATSPTSPEFLKWAFKEDDTDSMRTEKIEFNKKIDQIDSKYKFLIFPGNHSLAFVNQDGTLKTSDEGKQTDTLNIYAPESMAKILSNKPTEEGANSVWFISTQVALTGVSGVIFGLDIHANLWR